MRAAAGSQTSRAAMDIARGVTTGQLGGERQAGQELRLAGPLPTVSGSADDVLDRRQRPRSREYESSPRRPPEQRRRNPPRPTRKTPGVILRSRWSCAKQSISHAARAGTECRTPRRHRADGSIARNSRDHVLQMLPGGILSYRPHQTFHNRLYLHWLPDPARTTGGPGEGGSPGDRVAPLPASRSDRESGSRRARQPAA